jgi:ubiquinone/menaquinone biosynthesis C-methylase UbiE
MIDRRESATDAVRYGPDVPTERDLRLLGDVTSKRVLDLGTDSGHAAIAFAKQGATVIAVDASEDAIRDARRAADREDARVEWHACDLADLAFLRADSIDVAFSAQALAEVEDLGRVFRQVHRVLRPNAPLVFSYDHPMALCVARDDREGALALGSLQVRQSWFDPSPRMTERNGQKHAIYPRSISEMFVQLSRAGFRVDALLELAPASEANPMVPATVVIRARKEGS